MHLLISSERIKKSFEGQTTCLWVPWIVGKQQDTGKAITEDAPKALDEWNAPRQTDEHDAKKMPEVRIMKKKKTG